MWAPVRRFEPFELRGEHLSHQQQIYENGRFDDFSSGEAALELT